jgi:hypothetical protein
MFENYDIQIITKTINTISEIEKYFIAYESTHEDEGIVEIRIFDVSEDYFSVCSQTFEHPIREKKAYEYIEKSIEEYEKKKEDNS